MGNGSHRISTERWQTTSDSERARKSPRNRVGKKKKEKKVRKQSGQDLCPWEGAVKEGRFLHPGKPPHWQGDLLRQTGSFRASEENAADGLRQPEWREQRIVSATALHSPA